MLELLVRRAEKTEPGFAQKRLRWALAFDAKGKFLEAVELGDAGKRGNRGQAFALCPEYERQFKQSGGKSEFLWDAASTVALFADDPGDEKLRTKHAHFVWLLEEAAGVVPVLAPVARTLADESQLALVRKALASAKAKSIDKTTLLIDGKFPVESSSWHAWWRKQYGEAASVTGAGPGARESAQRRLCFVTGRPAEPLMTHPKIEGLAGVGGQGMGDVLVGFDKDAFQSYNLEQSANAAVSKEAAYSYRAALNDLIRNSSRKLAGALVVHWFKDAVRAEDDPLAWLDEGAETRELVARHQAGELLRAIHDGKRPDLTDNRYYALTLSGMSGRVMVRDWMEGSFEELAANVGRWFDDLAVVHREGGRTAADPKFLAVLGSTVRELDNLTPPFVAKMWRVAARCEPIPPPALVQALARVKVDIIKDEPFGHARMGLLKAYFVRQDRMKGMEESEMKPNLNPDHPSPAYHCGRMMAVLAKLQQAALGDVGAGVVQRYYAAASAAPAMVLGRLVRGAQFHLNKLEGKGLAYWYEERMGEIMGRLSDSVPKTLTLEEQSLFALGYYQQWVDLRTKKSEDKKEA